MVKIEFLNAMGTQNIVSPTNNPYLQGVSIKGPTFSLHLSS
jgi:hypothetical protein